MTRKLHVVEVITTLGVGGAEMHLLALTRGLLARGHSAEVVYLKGAGELAQEFLRSGVSVRKIPMESMASAPGAILQLARFLRRARPDVVHTHLLKADAVGAVAALLAGRSDRLLSSKHNDERALLRRPVSLAHGALSTLDRRVIVLSDHVGRFVAEHGRVSPSKLRRIYYGVDPGPFERAEGSGARAALGIGPEEFVVICVARFAPQKDHKTLLDAFALARRQEPKLRLLLVGDDPFGDHRKIAEAHARTLSLGDSVLFLGIRRDVPALLAASNCFAMSSLWEGLGLVFLEAMATGLPVVATRVSAIPEVVPQGEAGLLVPAGDAAAMAQAFMDIARLPDRGRAMGVAGRAWVRQQFGIDRMVDETLDVLREVDSQAPTR